MPSRCCSRTICSPTCRCSRAITSASLPPATPPTRAPWEPPRWPGTTYPLDRFATAEALGFDHPIPNSLDAVSDRDFLLDLIYACSVSCLHLSRLCEEIVLWSSAEFGFITLSDAYSTGSSIMPQKKNPDFAELIRGKSGRSWAIWWPS